MFLSGYLARLVLEDIRQQILLLRMLWMATSQMNSSPTLIFKPRLNKYMFECLGGHTNQRVSITFFDSEKLTNFSCAPDGVPTWVTDVTESGVQRSTN